MKYLLFSLFTFLTVSIAFTSCKDDDDCTETIWYQDADGDGLGNPDVSQSNCDQPAGYVSNADDDDDVCGGTLDECGVCDGTGAPTWYEDADGDGLGNPDISQESCIQPTGYVVNADDEDDSGNTGLHAAFEEFDSENFTIYLDGDEVVIESNGLPNHTSPYWSNTTARSAIDPMGNTLGLQPHQRIILYLWSLQQPLMKIWHQEILMILMVAIHCAYL